MIFEEAVGKFTQKPPQDRLSDNPKLIREGTWLYSNAIPVRVIIEQISVKHGNRDKSFHIAHSAPGNMRIVESQGNFSSVNEAVSEVEKLFKGIQWHENNS